MAGCCQKRANAQNPAAPHARSSNAGTTPYPHAGGSVRTSNAGRTPFPTSNDYPVVEEDYYNDETYDGYTSSSGNYDPPIPDTTVRRLATEPFVTDKMLPFRVKMRNDIRKRINAPNMSPTSTFNPTRDGAMYTSQLNTGYGRDLDRTPPMRPQRLDFDNMAQANSRGWTYDNPGSDSEYESVSEYEPQRFALGDDIRRRINDLNMNPIITYKDTKDAVIINVKANPTRQSRNYGRDTQQLQPRRLDFR